MTYSKKVGKPPSLRQIVLDLLKKESLSIDAISSKLFEPRDRVRIAMERLVNTKQVVFVGKTPGNRYIYKAASAITPRSIVKTDPAASWLFNKVMK